MRAGRRGCDPRSQILYDTGSERVPMLIRSTVMTVMLSATACVPIVWDKPGATQAEVSADNYTCKAQARALSPGGSYAQGRIGFVVVATLVSALATEADRNSLYGDCMTAHGYTPRQAYAAAAQSRAPVAPAPIVPTSEGTLQQSASSSASAADVPHGPGRVVLFPVTIYNPYYPPSVFVDLQ
jgi:hypothetical protein